ncbi:MAG: carboxypeptidase-like regulatory domain-containing protein [Catalinimonas sp.]
MRTLSIRTLTILALLGASCWGFAPADTPAAADVHFLKTSLRVTVLDELGNPAEGAEVRLYASQADYDSSQNVIATVRTDDRGRAKFSDLEPKVYFIEVEHGDRNNYGLGTKTEPLEEKRLNKVSVVVS